MIPYPIRLIIYLFLAMWTFLFYLFFSTSSYDYVDDYSYSYDYDYDYDYDDDYREMAPGGSQENSSFGVTFSLEGLDITFDEGYYITDFYNDYSEYTEYDGANIIAIPITVTNNGNNYKSFDSLYHIDFSPDGLELAHIINYFLDDSIYAVGSIEPEATSFAYFYMLYEGDGDYTLEFHDFDTGEITEIILPITY